VQQKMKRQAIMFEGGSLKLVTEETPVLKDKEVLIRVRYSPITNFDKACLAFKKERKVEEKVLAGSEGSGIIEFVGPGVSQDLKGRKVAFCHGGWSQFVVKHIDHLLFFDDKVDLKLAATAVINPLTAISIKYMLLDRKAKSFVFLGANSTLGRIFIKIAMRKGLEPIAIVQNADEVKLLKKDLGLNFVLSCEDKDFLDQLRDLVTKNKTEFMIDAVGSEKSACIF